MMKLAQVDFENLQKAIGARNELSQITNSPSIISAIINVLIPYIYIAAGTILLLYLLYGGFMYLTSTGDPKKIAAGKEVLTNALVGFIIVFTSYWLVQLVLIILGLPSPVKYIFGVL